MSFDALDDFAGPGGWSEGARMVGLRDIGLEWDHAACHTAVKAGHLRIRADVSAYPSALFAAIPGYIGSPPCTLFSSAGSGVGNLVIGVLAAGVVRMLNGEDCREEVRAAIYPVTLAEREAANHKRGADKKWTQERVETTARTDAFIASLVLEPARRIHDLRPEWVALEQVPEVLPIWQTYVRVLRHMGYSAWTGVLNAADYGVPQTRQRAVVMASRVRPVAPPVPTHSPSGDAADLFGDGREKWVSMATALGWDASEGPSQTVTSKARSWLRMGNQNGAAVRHIEEPAPTVLFGHRSNSVEWFGERPPTREERERLRFVAAGVTGEGRPKNPETQPADTLTGKGTAYWCYDRSATTVVGSFNPDVISPPGYRTQTSRQNAEGGVRVTVAEGGVLQSFPADYPWQGSRTKQYQQVGNAIPPLLAAHILAALTGAEIRAAA